MDSSSLISVRNLTKFFTLGDMRVEILKGISLDIFKGEMVALVGTSGSGKSTLMNILGCLDRPSSGEYFLDQRELTNATNDERARIRNEKLGFVFQSFNLLPRTSALENVLMPLTYSQNESIISGGRERGIELLASLGLKDRLDHEPSQLSGGQQQRVAIARALINNPPIIFADEPTGNLDSKTTEGVLDLFRELNRSHGITIILVTHEQEVAARADRIVKLKDGMIE